MKKKLISSLLAAALTLSLAACGSAPAASGSEAASEPAASSDAAASTESAAPTGDGFDASVDYAALAGTTITVAASPVPHAEILAVAADILAQADITLDVMEFTDYIQPNQATENGEVDANYFQHGPYLENFNAENGTSTPRTAPTSSASARSTTNRSACTRARPRAWTPWPTARRSACPTTPPMKPARCS